LCPGWGTGKQDAAEEIAQRQPGAVNVVNDMEVKIDSATELLRFRMMLLEQGSGRPRRETKRIDD
jgi:hypothetical protein